MPVEFQYSEHLKNDFQNAKKRNLHTWTLWRIRLNEQLVQAVLNGEELQDIEPIRRYLNREVPDPHHPTTNPKTLLSYSAAGNTSTNLRRQYFYKYGIPRAKLDPCKQETMIKSRLRSAAAGEYTPTTGDDLRNQLAAQFGGGLEDFALDYFHYNDDVGKEEERKSEQKTPARSRHGNARDLFIMHSSRTAAK